MGNGRVVLRFQLAHSSELQMSSLFLSRSLCISFIHIYAHYNIVVEQNIRDYYENLTIA